MQKSAKEEVPGYGKINTHTNVFYKCCQMHKYGKFYVSPKQ